MNIGAGIWLFLDKCLKVNRKWIPLALVILLAAIVFVIKRCQTGETNTRTETHENPEDPNANINRDHGFDRRASFLEYSKHAKCRMECRKITQAEVLQIMKEGNVNYKKSKLKDVRCPRYAVEGITSDNQRVRIVYAQCNEKTVVVTVIDLGQDWACDCPGDDQGSAASTHKYME